MGPSSRDGTTINESIRSRSLQYTCRLKCSAVVTGMKVNVPKASQSRPAIVTVTVTGTGGDGMVASSDDWLSTRATPDEIVQL